MHTTVLSTNPSFALLKNEEKEIMFSLYGEIKLMRGPVRLINAILDDLKGSVAKDELVGRLALEYPLGDADQALTHLVRSGILMEESGAIKREFESQDKPQVIVRRAKEERLACIGDGQLSRAVMAMRGPAPVQHLSLLNMVIPVERAKPEERLRSWTDFFEERLAPLGLSALAVCPENMSYLKLAALNRACLNLSLPWVLAYFNGNHIALGPSIAPFKTPCLECLLEHRLRAMSPRLELGWQDFWDCTENFAFPADSSWQGALDWSAWLLAAELDRLATGHEAPLYMKRQLHITREASPEINSIIFEPVTTCPACEGMNLGRVKTRPASVPDNLERVEITLRHDTARHGDNGLRSKTAEEARELIDHALAKLKTNVKIKLCRGGALDDIIPSFRSHTATVYSPDLPFNVYAKHHWGKGMNEKQAYLSAGFELMERICAEYARKVEMIRCPYGEVRDVAIDLETRVGRQCYLRNVDKVSDDIVVDWVWGWSLFKRKPLLVPASMVYHSKAVFKGKFMLGGSSGLAAGTTMEDAILQGLLETVEHDARYIWQANPLVLPRLCGLPPAVEKIAARLRDRGFELVVRDYSSDLGIYIFRAWITQPDNPLIFAAAGLGASLNPEIALNRAVTEAKQAWPSDRLSAPPHYASKSNADLFNYNSASQFMHHQDVITDLARGGKVVDYAALPDLSSGSITRDIYGVMERISANAPGADVVAVNLSREEFGVPVVRVISSGLQNPSQPLQNFPGERLFNLRAKMGYSSKRLAYKEIFNDVHQQ